MSRKSFHVDPDIEGEVMHALEEAGLKVEVGHGPMVDWTVDSGDSK
jgi:hypothetical protein